MSVLPITATQTKDSYDITPYGATTCYRLIGGKRHLFSPDYRAGLVSLCGVRWGDGGRWVECSSTDLCAHCHRAAFTRFGENREAMPEITPRMATRGAEIHPEAVREVEGRVFRVAGKSDIYTVTVPLDPNLASVCTCMAGKVHPDVMCKHQVRVFLTLHKGREMGDERGEGRR